MSLFQVMGAAYLREDIAVAKLQAVVAEQAAGPVDLTSLGIVAAELASDQRALRELTQRCLDTDSAIFRASGLGNDLLERLAHDVLPPGAEGDSAAEDAARINHAIDLATKLYAATCSPDAAHVRRGSASFLGASAAIASHVGRGSAESAIESPRRPPPLPRSTASRADVLGATPGTPKAPAPSALAASQLTRLTTPRRTASPLAAPSPVSTARSAVVRPPHGVSGVTEPLPVAHGQSVAGSSRTLIALPVVRASLPVVEAADRGAPPGPTQRRPVAAEPETRTEASTGRSPTPRARSIAVPDETATVRTEQPATEQLSRRLLQQQPPQDVHRNPRETPRRMPAPELDLRQPPAPPLQQSSRRPVQPVQPPGPHSAAAPPIAAASAPLVPPVPSRGFVGGSNGGGGTLAALATDAQATLDAAALAATQAHRRATVASSILVALKRLEAAEAAEGGPALTEQRPAARVPLAGRTPARARAAAATTTPAKAASTLRARPGPLPAPQAASAVKRVGAAAPRRRTPARVVPAPRLPPPASTRVHVSLAARARQQRRVEELHAVYGQPQPQVKRGQPRLREGPGTAPEATAAAWDPEAELADAEQRPQPPFVVRHVPSMPLSPQFPPLPASTRWLETGVIVRRRLDESIAQAD